METIYLGLVIFLFMLAVFDLWVGVSNDAVNFLNSAIGAKAATFRTIMTIAAIGIFCGATMSSGMMDIARHGIFRPEQFYFDELMCIFLAVMVTDIILLDIFNSLGLPTSTTVSMVFSLLGGTSGLTIIKLAHDKDEEIRLAAIAGMGKIGKDDSFNAIVPDMLTSDDAKIRAAAAEALGVMNNEHASAHLRYYLEREKDATVIAAMKKAISSLSNDE